MAERDQSEFNMSVSYLNRLNVLIYAANQCSIQQDIYNWFMVLQALFRELSPEMKPAEIEEYINPADGKILKINTRIMQYMAKHNAGRGVPTDLYYMLFGFEMFLREIIKKSGLGVKMKDSPDQALQ